jgi:DNA-binding transcriptional MerR regulator
MRMGEFSRRTGVSQRLLRYYEEQGLLSPNRLSSGYRDYSDGDIATVRAIRQLLAAGLNTATIAELLPCMVVDGQLLDPACPGILPDLHKERERLNNAIGDLLAARDALDTIANAAASDLENMDACLAMLSGQAETENPADCPAAVA